MRLWDFDMVHANGHRLVTGNITESGITSFRAWLKREGYTGTETLRDLPGPPEWAPPWATVA